MQSHQFHSMVDRRQKGKGERQKDRGVGEVGTENKKKNKKEQEKTATKWGVGWQGQDELCQDNPQRTEFLTEILLSTISQQPVQL